MDIYSVLNFYFCNVRISTCNCVIILALVSGTKDDEPAREDNSDDNESGLSNVVIGGAIGGILLMIVAIILVLVFISYTRRVQKRKTYPTHNKMANGKITDHV